jgi:N utilization substance protein B
MGRIKARKQAFEFLFSETFKKDDSADIIKTFQENNEKEKIDDFTVSIFNGVIKNKSEIDLIIKRNIENWNFNRISRVTKTALRIAIYEIIFEKNIPAAISINESVEIAKRYGAKDDSSYVQAVLTSVERDIKNNFNH